MKQLTNDDAVIQRAAIYALRTMARAGMAGDREWQAVAPFLVAHDLETRFAAADAAVQFRSKLSPDDTFNLLQIAEVAGERLLGVPTEVSYLLPANIVELLIANLTTENMHPAVNFMNERRSNVPFPFLRLQVVLDVLHANETLDAASLKKMFAVLMAIAGRRETMYFEDVLRLVTRRSSNESPPGARFRLGNVTYGEIGFGQVSRLEAITALGEVGAELASADTRDCLLTALKKQKPTSTTYFYILSALIHVGRVVADGKVLVGVCDGIARAWAVSPLYNRTLEDAAMECLVDMASRVGASEVIAVCQHMQQDDLPEVRELGVRLAIAINGRATTSTLVALVRTGLEDRETRVRYASLEVASRSMEHDDAINLLLPHVRRRLADDQSMIRDAAWQLAIQYSASFRPRRQAVPVLASAG